MTIDGNIFTQVSQAIPSEIVESIRSADNIRIERIISRGHKSEEGFWYDQEENEWVMLLKGNAQLEFEDRMINLSAGDYIDIPAHRKHRVAWTDPQCETIWLAIFY